MSKFLIRGGNRLSGSVKVDGAKNAVLPILAASILASEGTSTIEDVPWLADVETISEVIGCLGAEVRREGDSVLHIDSRNVNEWIANESLVRKMRASFLVMGPLLARMGKARVALPGGCAIGARPVDQHIKGFQALGAEVDVGHGHVEARLPEGRRLQGTRIYLDIQSVGATQNIMMAASLAEGRTIIENAAKEPEIVDLANYLNAMGANVRGAGTDVIRIEGVESLRGANHAVIPDRIQAGTFLIASAMTGGDVYVEGAISNHLKPVIAKMKEAGIQIEEDVNGIRVIGGPGNKHLDVKTLPYPGFPTDMQAQMMALLTVLPGNSLVTESVFENRFMHVAELQRMGADIKVEGRTALITGVPILTGAGVTASDLRAGAALVIAGLGAQGETEVNGLHHIDRGYLRLEDKLREIGADIERVE
ncbi:UDP-N-acetylglucosamine 1-carboxyvinyltransferase [Effusibacillus lacus]|uniref:UDP-N-acetylglucosamine 1-carboxyvinyltransferase n=1 Tax=Effusibacillus lacus TaxID=1348429 RepID=A0A292YL45_9BACL|nr:UDP-N-acetylglucosamine 1-carboxyvinyltransferase [Effusibacillus lacus]TCS71801.1 UDP-N-acetylglucosamine 1-carboxyvinyltransferase [Effusibacillus lacus]GAX89631.1 UDP-N-acetylglucosamine 1-carboxyvinyltransferase [Effusibacillus lacus]